jgi:two-component system cell cycle sensor histidine kinase/response regulator CckA
MAATKGNPLGSDEARSQQGLAGSIRGAWLGFHAWLQDIPIQDPLVLDNAVVIQLVGGLGVLGLVMATFYRLRIPGEAAPGDWFPFALAAAALAIALVLVRLGHHHASLWCINGALLINVAVPILGGGMTYGLGFTREWCIPLAIAALLLDRRSLWLMFGLIVAVCALGAARDQGLLGPILVRPIAIPPFGAFGSTVVIFFFIALVLDRLSSALRSSLSRATEREEALKESETNLRFMLDMFPDAATLVRLDTQTFVAVSGGFTRYSGLTQAQALGKTSRDLNLWVEEEARTRFLEIIQGGGVVADMEARFHLKDGETATALVWGRVTTIGGVPHLLTVLRDISDWKRAQEERDRLQEQIQHAQRLDSLGSLAGGVAHDFNNMLGGIMGFAELLLAEEQEPVRAGRLRSIIRAASRSGELTRKLLAFGRKGKDLVEPVNLGLVVKECLAMLRPSMHSDLRVEVDLEDCPGIDADPGQMHQVVLNLCINGLEAMRGPGTLTLRSCTRVIEEPTSPDFLLPAGIYLELAVSDTGIGMSEEVRQRIFEPFFTTKTEAGKPGTGLGLSTVYGIVHSHRGSIEVDSQPGAGTRFRILIPAGTLVPAGAVSLPSSRKGHGEVLLVEDELLLREAATSALESLGYVVHAAGDGAAGLEAFRDHHATLLAVLLDLKMPVMGGREAFLEMHRIDPDVPVLVCTGFGENEEVQALRSQGAVGMLSKPYRIADLAEALGRLAHN